MGRIRIPDNAPGGLREEDYAFSFLDSQGQVWDVYHFMMNGKAVIKADGGTPGTIAFRFDKRTQQWIIGILCKEHLDKTACYQKLLPKPKEPVS